jgi:hypothetical protein
MPRPKKLISPTVTPKAKTKGVVRTITQKVSQNTISIHGSALLKILEKSGLIFDATGSVKIKFPLSSSYGRPTYKTMTIIQNREYEISCSKKTVEGLSEPSKKTKNEDIDHDIDHDISVELV